MTENVILIPEESRLLVLYEESRTVDIPGEWRVIEVYNDASGQ